VQVQIRETGSTIPGYSCCSEQSIQSGKAPCEGATLSGSEDECVCRMGKGSGVRSEAQLLRPQEVKLPVPPAALAARVGMVHYISTIKTPSSRAGAMCMRLRCHQHPHLPGPSWRPTGNYRSY
jgi:hypothetical protein